jgi:predicted Zn-dependent protease with MMP-like domain
MSEIHPGEYGSESDKQVPQQAEQRISGDERNTRNFFMLLCFFLAAILLAVFLTSAHDTLIEMLLLFGVIGLVILGVRFFEKGVPRRLFSQASTSSQDGTGEDTTPVDTQAEEDENENDSALTPFELLVQEALDSIPEDFHVKMQNLAVMVEDEPDVETQQRVGMEEGHILLGLYQGTPLTVQSYNQILLPERIIIYQHTIEWYCHGDPDRIREQVRSTVLHEVAHHFGMGHEEMPIWVR